MTEVYGTETRAKPRAESTVPRADSAGEIGTERRVFTDDSAEQTIFRQFRRGDFRLGQDGYEQVFGLELHKTIPFRGLGFLWVMEGMGVTPPIQRQFEIPGGRCKQIN